MGERADERAPERSPEREWPVPWQPVWGESSGLGSRLGTWVVRGALAGAARTPEALLAPGLRALAALGAAFGRKRTRAAHAFLRQAFGDLPPDEIARLARSGWLQLLRVSVDGERLGHFSPERLRECFELVTSPAARAVLDARRGFVVVSGHLGNWEAGLAFLVALGLHPVYGVAKPPKNLYLSRALQASRERWGLRILSRKGAMADAPAILKAGGALGMIIDQRTSGRALLAPFFGRMARCERAPAVLLKRQRVPLVIASCLMEREPLRYRFELGEVLAPEEWGRRPVEEIVTRVNEGLERLIRANPEQYVWIHDRYRDTPDALAPGADARILRSPQS